MRFSSFFTYCPHCSTELREFRSDDILRRKCPRCDWVQYRNPSVGAAVVIVEQDRLLVGRRRSGGWCIPCGHVELDEAVEQAAVREMVEETGLKVSIQGVCAVKSNFHDLDRQTVGIWFHGRRDGGSLRAGGDLVEVTFRGFVDLPALTFPTDRQVVEELRDGRA